MYLGSEFGLLIIKIFKIGKSNHYDLDINQLKHWKMFQFCSTLDIT